MTILLLFGSAKYGFTPLTTIVFGSLWALGFTGLMGMKLSSTTSLSMIMGTLILPVPASHPRCLNL
ncbi:hypothetical protein METP1_03224 [Methanosarcinales archaeon]|nr:hypothetical protein METP1_03224 [Methanosarcinales archaeon]